MKIYTKQKLITQLKSIAKQGWIENKKHGNQGGIGNTLEYLLGIKENNLPIPNASEWELKTQNKSISSLITLFHSEPSPRAIKFVPSLLLPNYGWTHKKAGEKYPNTEMSFRQTIHGKNSSDRGFIVKIDRKNSKVLISFNGDKIDQKHNRWKEIVNNKVGLNELNPQPYWGFDDLQYKAGTKLLNTFYVKADVKKDKISKKKYYHYNKVLMLEKFNFEGFLQCLEDGNILVDFDARTGHNHGSKFRLRQNHFIDLYKKITEIL